MVFRGRTVLVMVVAAMLLGCIATVLVVDPQLSFVGNMQRGGSGTAGQAHSGSEGNGGLQGLTPDEINKINTAYMIIENRFLTGIDRNEVVDGAIQGMLDVLDDPYSVYMDKVKSVEFDQQVGAFFTGIGAEVSLEDGYVIVVAPIKGSPAEKAGIRPRDLILSVNGEQLKGLSLNEAVMKIRGPKGTQARLEILREGYKEPIELILVRDEIDLETVFSEMLEDGIGKIEIRQFSEHTVDSFKEQLADLREQNLQALIIDVRNNPGGYLHGVVDILNELVPEGKVLLQSEMRGAPREKVLSEGPGLDVPIVVLINGGSASASEILAAAVKESAGGKLVGETTYGKGTIQTQYDRHFPDGSLLKLTTGKWLTPRGNWLDREGLKPDVEVALPEFFHVAPLNRERTWKFNDLGEDVKNMQIMLDAVGFDPGRRDGYFSEETAAALQQFQESAELPATGELDAETMEMLEREVIELMVKPENDLQLQTAIRAARELAGL